jgi:hypothetical protein
MRWNRGRKRRRRRRRGGGRARSEAGLDSLFVDILFYSIAWVKEGGERELGENGSEGEQAGGAGWTGGCALRERLDMV